MTGVPLSPLRPLLARLTDLKRVRTPDHRGESLAAVGFRRAWAALVAGEEPRQVALRETAIALAATELAGIDADVLLAGGLTRAEALAVQKRALAVAAQPLLPWLAAELDAALADEPGRATGPQPGFVDRLARQPRAGATHPTRPRLILEPPESHADHCYSVAVMGVVLGPWAGDSAYGQAFVCGLAHHLHNAALPDAGFAGEELLGDRLQPVMAKFTEVALGELAPDIAARVRRAREVAPLPRLAGRQGVPRRGRARPGAGDGPLRPRRAVPRRAGARRVGTGPRRAAARVPERGADRGRGAVVTWIDAASRETLTLDGGIATGTAGRTPVVAGIPYLRPGRDELRRAALERLDAGDELGALALLLTDQDPFAPLPPPAVEVAREVASDPFRLGAVECMRRLNFGPVADYFALRTSTPTFLSGLALLNRGVRPGGTLVELACGVGQFLRPLAQRGVKCVGVDLVFSKLWLAKTFVCPDAEYVCGDAAAPPILLESPATAFCHDAFYFLPDKPAALAAMQSLAGGGPVLVGHAHNRLVDSGVAGTPLTPGGYAELAPDAQFYDDADLADEARTGTPARVKTPAELADAEAVAFALGESRGGLDLAAPLPGVPLALNPLLADADGELVPRWPSERFAHEYRSATYLRGRRVPDARLMALAAAGDVGDAEVRRLARDRILLDLPRGWR